MDWIRGKFQGGLGKAPRLRGCRRFEFDAKRAVCLRPFQERHFRIVIHRGAWCVELRGAGPGPRSPQDAECGFC